MANPVDDRGSDAFLRLLVEGLKGPKAKSAAIEALAGSRVWLATWEPRAEGFRTLINGDGEEALAVFSSEKELMAAAGRFGWLDSEGAIATHESMGADIVRHAWTREYAFLVVDIAAQHSLEFDREELRTALRELDRTGPFRTSRPPAPSTPRTPAAASSFPPPVEKVSTMYSMAPSRAEKLDRLSDLPTKPHEVPDDSEPPTRPHRRPTLDELDPNTGNRPSSRPAAKPDSDAPPSIREVVPDSATINAGGTYGAASVVPPAARRAVTPASPVVTSDSTESTNPVSETAPGLHSDAPTAPAAQASELLKGGKLALPPIGPIGKPQAPTEPPAEPQPKQKPTVAPPNERASRVAPPSIGDTIELVQLLYPPDEALLETLTVVLRRYPEIEWASYCQVARPAGDPSPAVGLRVMDTYRDNVTTIIKDLCQAGRSHDVELDVLLVDGHDLLRKAREGGFVFFPWKPKPFGS
ncbi:MAG: SseB family protein [Myxococcota bacterium]